MRRVSRSWLVFMLAGIFTAGVCAAADLPLIGRWRLNSARSDFGGLTLAFASAPAGVVRISQNGGPYRTISLDGRDVPSHSGYSSAWRQLDSRTWASTTKLNGAVISVDQFQLSDDDKTLVAMFTSTQPDGTSSVNRLTYVRTTGKTGLIGSWKAMNMSQREEAIEFLHQGDGGLTLRTATASREAQLDGKDYPLIGPTMPAGATAAFSQTGPRAVLLLQKQSGRLIYKSTLTVSPDARTLTETVLATDTGRTKATKVYERE
jgi:hypothetical protein